MIIESQCIAYLIDSTNHSKALNLDAVDIKYDLPDTSDEREVYTYNENGQILSVIQYNESNILQPYMITEFTYDENNRQVIELSYYPYKENSQRTMKKMMCDINGYIVEQQTFQGEINGDFKETGKEKYSRDIHGNLLERFDYDMERQEYWRQYSALYDKTGKKLESKSFMPDGTFWRRGTFSYSKDGKLLEHISYSDEGEVGKMLYIYEDADFNGNFLKETIRGLGNIPYTVTERKIEYY